MERGRHRLCPLFDFRGLGESTMRRVIDLSHPLEEGMTTHPGIPSPVIRPFLTCQDTTAHYAPGVSFEVTRLEMVTSIGTYVDAPAHRYEGLPDLASIPLERYVDLPGLVVDVRSQAGRAIGPKAFAGLPLVGRAVLVCTGWDAHWNTPAYLEPAPYLTAGACRLLVDEGAALVGADLLNVDDREDLSRPAHSLLLAAGLGLVENLRGLDQLPPEGFRFHAAPVAVRGGVAFPVRAYAVVGS